MSERNKMEEKQAIQNVDPTVINILVSIGLALFGGAIKYLQEVRRSGSWKQKLKDATIDLAVSGFAGLLASFLFAGLGANQWLIWFASGYCGHLGGRTFGLARNYLKNQGIMK